MVVVRFAGGRVVVVVQLAGGRVWWLCGLMGCV